MFDVRVCVVCRQLFREIFVFQFVDFFVDLDILNLIRSLVLDLQEQIKLSLRRVQLLAQSVRLRSLCDYLFRRLFN